MSIFPKATPAPEPRTKESKQIATFYAIILIVLVVTQLVTLFPFLELLTTFDFPGGRQLAYFGGWVLVISEILAIPFLLRLKLSPALRWVSMVAGWITAAIWIKTSIWVIAIDLPIESIGFLGTLVPVLPGWWAVFISVALGVAAGWASWGLWPGKRKK